MPSVVTHPLTVGRVSYPRNLFLAPMAGYSTPAFASIAYEMGAALAFTEMVSAEAVCRENRKTLCMATPCAGAPAHAIQLFGSNPERCASAAVRLLAFNPSLIDFNCGCPVPKVTQTGAGAALMRHPDTIYRLVAAARSALDAAGAQAVALSVKIRSGWDSASLNFMEAAEAAWKGGADLVTLHPRTRAQGYAGSADWNCLKLLKKESPVPVCASGDLFTVDAVNRLFETTGVDAAMPARGALGQPWIFQPEGGPYAFLNEAPPAADGTNVAGEPQTDGGISPLQKRVEAVLGVALRHVRLTCRLYGETAGVRAMRGHLAAYTKGLPHGKTLRNTLVRLPTLASVVACFADYQKRLKNEES